MPEKPASDERILVLALTGRDARLTCQILSQAGLPCAACADDKALCDEIETGAGAVVLAEEALHPWTIETLRRKLNQQPPWSDLPLIIFTRSCDTNEALLSSLAPLGNTTILERPVRINTLISAIRAALRARRRQYQVRDLLQRQAEADRRKDEFLALLGHELRNPLAAIRNALWVLAAKGSDKEQDVRQREVIDRQTSHLVRMVDDLLDVSRVTLGKIILKHQPVDLKEALDRCLNELGMASLAASHGLALEVRSDPALVDGDPVRLEQVVCNLIQNAIKYTPRGGRIEVSVTSEGGQAVVRVCDSGVGIFPNMLRKIFEPFTQVESSRTRSEGGLGLGLPLVRSLVEMHGGTVEASSLGPGCGSEFIVRLPLRKADEMAQQASRKPAGKSGAWPRAAIPGDVHLGLQVLVVEDNQDGRESLRELLEIWGHRVEIAENGFQGVEKALALQPDVALIDIGLPGMDGNEVARQIRAAFGTDHMSLIAMTGYGQPEDRRRALQAGFDSYLVKPVDPTYLSRLLTETRQPRMSGASPS